MLENLQIEQIAAPVTWRLRLQVFYPTGSLKDVMLDDDFEGYHFGAYTLNVLVAVISLLKEADTIRCCMFAVLSDYREQGIGTALLSNALSFAMELGAHEILADVPEHTVDFYGRLGFRIVGERYWLRNEMYRPVALTC